VLFRKVVQDMVANDGLDITSRYPSLKQFSRAADFQFVILEKFLSYEKEFSTKEAFILNSYFAIKRLGQSDAKAFGLDTSEIRIEKIPMVVAPATNISLTKVEPSTYAYR